MASTQRQSDHPICETSFHLENLCFEHHPKATLVIRKYEEGKGFDRCCGFECLRLLAREFSIKTRTELLFFRSQLANATISAKSIPECVRKVQSELYQFERVAQLADPAVNTQGLDFLEADKVLLLLRALPQQCRQWIVLHSPDERFDTYIESALRYESQQRIWSDLNGQPIASIGEKGKDKGKKGKGKGQKVQRNKTKGRVSGVRQEHVFIVINEATLPVIAQTSIRSRPKVKATRKVQTKAKVRPRKVQTKERKERMRKESRKENVPLSFSNSPNQKSEVSGLSQN